MKLSDKLAQTEGGDAAPATSAAAAAPRRRVARRAVAQRPPIARRPAGEAAPAPDSSAARLARRGEGAANRLSAAKKKVRELVLAELAPSMSGPDALAGDDLKDAARAAVDAILAREEGLQVSPGERRAFVAELLADLLGYGALDGLLKDPHVTEVMCNDYDEIWVERDGKIERSDVVFADPQQYRQVIDKIVQQAGRRLDESSPMVDARLPDGSRVNAVIPPISINGPTLTIRRFSEDPYTIQDLIGFGSITDDASLLLEACVRGKLNVLVSGGTGSGKTTLLNVLSRFIPEGERIITIEDAAELRLQQPHVVTMEARPANAEGAGAVTIRDLVRNSLRMRPDRIVVGECRGGEALDMLQAMNTGHDGSLTTIHANSTRDALSRLETLVLMAGMELPQRAIREQIASAVDVIVQLDRLGDGQRKVVAITEVQGMEDATIITQDVFRYEPRVEGGRYVGGIEPTGLRPRFMEHLKEMGIDVPAAVLRPGARSVEKSSSGLNKAAAKGKVAA